jgi:anti-sigma-K factor RskA
MSSRLSRSEVEACLADFVTGMLDAKTEQIVREALVAFPDLEQEAAEMMIVREYLSRGVYNAEIDARAQRVSSSIGTANHRRNVWFGATLVATAVAAVYLLFVFPYSPEQFDRENEQHNVDEQANFVSDVDSFLLTEPDNLHLDLLLNAKVDNHMVFLTTDDLQYLLDNDNDS